MVYPYARTWHRTYQQSPPDPLAAPPTTTHETPQKSQTWDPNKQHMSKILTETQKLTWTLTHLICETWCSFLSLRSSDCRRNRLQYLTISFFTKYKYDSDWYLLKFVQVIWLAVEIQLQKLCPQTLHKALILQEMSDLTVREGLTIQVDTTWTETRERRDSQTWHIDKPVCFTSKKQMDSVHSNYINDCWSNVSSMCHVGGHTYH